MTGWRGILVSVFLAALLVVCGGIASLFLWEVQEIRDYFGLEERNQPIQELYYKHQNAIVVVRADAVVDLETDGVPLPKQRQSTETLGVVISADGLVVMSNSGIDPSLEWIGQKARVEGRDSLAAQLIVDAKATLENVTIISTDGEYQASTVYEDRDLDLRFVKIDPSALAKSGQTGFQHVEVSEYLNFGQVGIGDEVLALARAAPEFDFIVSVVPGRVSGILQSHPVFYITTAASAKGVPVFTDEGEFLGFTVQRVIDGKGTNLIGTLSAESVNFSTEIAKSRVLQAQRSGR